MMTQESENNLKATILQKYFMKLCILTSRNKKELSICEEIFLKTFISTIHKLNNNVTKNVTDKGFHKLI